MVQSPCQKREADVTHAKNPIFILTFILSVALDLGTKKFFSDWLRLGQSVDIIPGFFSFTLVHNRGAAFGIGTGWSTPIFLLFSLLALVVVVTLFFQLKPHEKLSAFGLSMILGGAFGNIFDRIRLGYVVDFLHVYVKDYHWPVFNAADSLITVGAVLLGIEMLRSPKEKKD